MSNTLYYDAVEDWVWEHRKGLDKDTADAVEGDAQV